jgi:hypothetical protein
MRRGASGMDEVFAADVEGIRWFSAVGEQLPAFNLPAIAVASTVAALEHCSDPAWEQVTLEARNQLTESLCKRYRDRYAEWNNVADAAQSRVVTPLVNQVWKPFAERYELGKVFVDCVSWDVMAAIMEHEYRDCSGRPVFFLDLLDVYRAGHFPCGWSGEWPKGNLLVF